LFTPTDTATRNLTHEGIPSERVRQVGDVMYDAALFYAARAEARSRIIEKLCLTPKDYLLATVHRAENTDDSRRLTTILEGFAA
jgi:UDP-GlcNAc3NAcA epimerase